MGLAISQSVERDALALVGAVGETAAAGQCWRTVLSQGMQKLFRAKMGAVSDIGPVRPVPNPRPVRMTDVGLDPSEHATLFSYIQNPEVFDPFLSQVMAGPRTNRVVVRRQIVPDDQWYGIPLLDDHMLKVGLDDVLAGLFVDEGMSSGFMMIAVRPKGEQPFHDREIETMRLIHRGLNGWCRFLVDHDGPTLSRAGEPVVATATPPQLSPRLRQLLEFFIEGKSEKQAAEEMGLSRHTVHMHAKRLYRAMQVKTRAELVSKALRARKAESSMFC